MPDADGLKKFCWYIVQIAATAAASAALAWLQAWLSAHQPGAPLSAYPHDALAYGAMLGAIRFHPAIA